MCKRKHFDRAKSEWILGKFSVVITNKAWTAIKKIWSRRLEEERRERRNMKGLGYILKLWLTGANLNILLVNYNLFFVGWLFKYVHCRK